MQMVDKKFEQKNKKVIDLMSKNHHFRNLTKLWFMISEKYQYSYHFTWFNRPIIQYPQDIIALQEIIWRVKPDLIIETGIAHGGSLIFSASILELIGNGQVLGIDVDIRKHNRIEIEKHSMFKRITMIQGSSISKKVVKQVYNLSRDKKRVMLLLDSNHTHKHVLKEMEFYSPLVTKGSYMIVFDTVIDDISDQSKHSKFKRPWGKGNNPKTAVYEFLKKNDQFKIDKQIQNKLLITTAPDGYLKRIKN